MRRAVKFSESASVLVLGPRGSGKSLVCVVCLSVFASVQQVASLVLVNL